MYGVLSFAFADWRKCTVEAATHAMIPDVTVDLGSTTVPGGIRSMFEAGKSVPRTHDPAPIMRRQLSVLWGAMSA